MRRPRRIRPARPGELKAAYRRGDGADPAVQYAWGGGGAEGPDARVLSNALEGVVVHDGRGLVTELERRGYDPSTLKFTIRRKEPAG